MAVRDATPNATAATLLAPAKVNLRLDLLGKRSDGFHELSTVMAALRWGDTLHVRRRDDADDVDKLRVQGEPSLTRGVPIDGANLVLQAVERLRRESGDRRPPLDFTLVKRVPNQAGLGGGSSDAAAALVAADRLWGLGWPTERLAEVAGRLGSDLPFFVHAIRDPRRVNAAIATGRGERIRPMRLGGGDAVVVWKPEAGLSTAEVYRACRLPDDAATEEEVARGIHRAVALGSRAIVRLADWGANGLRNAALRVAPWIEPALLELRRLMGFVMLSGSGSACFAPAPSAAVARRVASRLNASGNGRAWATRFA